VPKVDGLCVKSIPYCAVAVISNPASHTKLASPSIESVPSNTAILLSNPVDAVTPEGTSAHSALPSTSTAFKNCPAVPEV